MFYFNKPRNINVVVSFLEEMKTLNEVMLQWHELPLPAGTPSRQSGHTATRIGDRIVFFGGRDAKTGESSDDLVALDCFLEGRGHSKTSGATCGTI